MPWRADSTHSRRRVSGPRVSTPRHAEHATAMIDDSPRSLLLACLHQDPQRLAAFDLPPDDSPLWDALVALAAVQRVRPRVYQRLKAAGIGPDRVRHALEQANRQVGLRNLRLQRELAAVAGFLRVREIPVAVL